MLNQGDLVNLRDHEDSWFYFHGQNWTYADLKIKDISTIVFLGITKDAFTPTGSTYPIHECMVMTHSGELRSGFIAQHEMLFELPSK